MSVEFWLDLAVLTLVWAGIACAWNILAGYAGQFSLGHAAYIGIGAYTPTLLASKFGLSPWIGMLLGALLAAMAAAFISGVSLRARGPFFTLMSIAFAEVARILAVYFKGITNGSEGLMLELRPGWATLYFLYKPPYLLVAAAYAALMFAIAVGIRRSRLGFQLLALREDESAARSLGVPVLRVRVGASMISASGTALGGTILAFYTQFIDPDSTMSFLISVQPALITMLGGLGSSFGPLFGALLVVPLEHLLRSALGGVLFGLHGLIFGLLLIAILLTMPDGIVEGWRRMTGRRRERTDSARG
jgi:branched-chain amino acid transport system permease protein